MESCMTITFLGTGTSHGVPAIDCMMQDYHCCPKKVCKDALTDAKHRRTRSSILIQFQNRYTLIDVSADFREQVLREEVTSIDAVLLTHMHADHIMGMPDIRSYSRLRDEAIPLFGTAETLEAIKKSFSYVFSPDTIEGGGIPKLSCNEVSGIFLANGLTFIPIPVEHGGCSGCVGYRFKDVAYIPDVKKIPTSSMELLKGVKTLIIDGLRPERVHSTHMIIPEAISISEELAVEKVYFTHLCHDVHYINDMKLLKPNMFFAYDGLRLEM